MATIHLNDVGHAYGNAVRALEQADILFEDGKTYALLGPSGCGKTTMLNIISGLLTPSEGRVLLGGRDVTAVKTAERNIAQVFQFPVVYQSKTVGENLAFPLVCRGWDRARIVRRVGEIAELLGMTGRLGQSARRLTADEKQLISLGRGLVRDDVAALLMDEPLTVIDPHMKFDLRRRIKQVNDRTRHTVVYVTHDQNEAMTFADEVLVMSAGRVVQRGTPQALFERPCDLYVGNFIGSPGMNFLRAERTEQGLALGGTLLAGRARLGAIPPAAEVVFGIRPEHLAIAADGEAGVPAAVLAVQDHGNLRVVDVAVGAERMKIKQARNRPVPSGTVRVTAAADRIRLYADGRLVD
jgi:glycerol transport system ATP-binding protein